jgi:hypothetical protein
VASKVNAKIKSNSRRKTTVLPFSVMEQLGPIRPDPFAILCRPEYHESRFSMSGIVRYCAKQYVTADDYFWPNFAFAIIP